mmetsp:Transcript_10422/g.27591  ORF Transcript_10422/g.27591 Transcript_10422/m.27591 type:complete len:282 (+) Transcript_10422:341-1186(+)
MPDVCLCTIGLPSARRSAQMCLWASEPTLGAGAAARWPSQNATDDQQASESRADGNRFARRASVKVFASGARGDITAFIAPSAQRCAIGASSNSHTLNAETFAVGTFWSWVFITSGARWDHQDCNSCWDDVTSGVCCNHYSNWIGCHSCWEECHTCWDCHACWARHTPGDCNIAIFDGDSSVAQCPSSANILHRSVFACSEQATPSYAKFDSASMPSDLGIVGLGGLIVLAEAARTSASAVRRWLSLARSCTWCMCTDRADSSSTRTSTSSSTLRQLSRTI